MEWGTGEQAALSRMRTVTLEELQSMGMNREWALGWAALYRNELRHNPVNGSARGRAALMEFVARLLEDRAKDV